MASSRLSLTGPAPRASVTLRPGQDPPPVQADPQRRVSLRPNSPNTTPSSAQCPSYLDQAHGPPPSRLSIRPGSPPSQTQFGPGRRPSLPLNSAGPIGDPLEPTRNDLGSPGPRDFTPPQPHSSALGRGRSAAAQVAPLNFASAPGVGAPPARTGSRDSQRTASSIPGSDKTESRNGSKLSVQGSALELAGTQTSMTPQEVQLQKELESIEQSFTFQVAAGPGQQMTGSAGLFGEASACLNGTLDSDVKGYDEAIAQLQQINLREAFQFRSPLVIAAASGFPQVVRELILLRADVEQQDSHQRTAVGSAAAAGHVHCARVLLRAKANVEGVYRDTRALHAAVSGGHADVATLLLDGGAKTDGEDQSGRTPLLAAIAASRKEMVRLLLYWRASIEASKGKLSPLAAAAKDNNVEIARLLIEVRANVTGLSIEAAASHSETCSLELLLQARGNPNLTRALVDSTTRGLDPAVVCLLKYRASPDEKKDGRTPLAIAANHGFARIARNLLQAHADTEVLDKSDKTPLMLAVEAGHLQVAVELVRFGAKAGWLTAPLHGRESPLVRLLLREDHVCEELFEAALLPAGHEAAELRSLCPARNLESSEAFMCDEPYTYEGPSATFDALHRSEKVDASRQLLPGYYSWSCWLAGAHLARADLFLCSIPDITSAEVLEALAVSPNKSVMFTTVFHAAIGHAWRRVQVPYILETAVGLANLVLLAFSAAYLRSNGSVPLGIWIALAALVCRSGLDELCELVTVCLSRNSQRLATHVKSWRCWAPLFGLGIDAAGLWGLFMLSRDGISPSPVQQAQRACAAVFCICQWGRWIYSLRCAQMGLQLLPVLYGLWDSLNYIFALVIMTGGFVNAFAVSTTGVSTDGLPTWSAFFLPVFRDGLFSDSALLDISKADNLRLASTPDLGHGMLVVASFCIGLILVSQLVSVLTGNFLKHQQVAQELLLEERAYMIIKLMRRPMARLPWFGREVPGSFLWISKPARKGASQVAAKPQDLGIGVLQLRELQESLQRLLENADKPVTPRGSSVAPRLPSLTRARLERPNKDT